MHQLTMRPLAYWEDKIYGALAASCSCGLSFQGHTEEEIKQEHQKHQRGRIDFNRCWSCGGPTPCLRGD